MCEHGKNIQKLDRIETEMLRGRPVNLECFELDDDFDGSSENGACDPDHNTRRNNKNNDNNNNNNNNRVTAMRSACSSCTDDIQMKKLISKYAGRLVGKLEKVAVKAAEDKQHEEAVGRLRGKVQRLIKELEQSGGPCDPSTVLLNKYDCYRMAYYSLRDRVNAKKRPPPKPCNSGPRNVCAGRPKNRDNGKKIEKRCKRTETSKSNRDDDRENPDGPDVQDNREYPDRRDSRKYADRRDNRERSEVTDICELCGKRKRRGGMMGEPKLYTDKAHCRKKPYGWGSFIKRRFLVYFPCLCCMLERTE